MRSRKVTISVSTERRAAVLNLRCPQCGAAMDLPPEAAPVPLPDDPPPDPPVKQKSAVARAILLVLALVAAPLGAAGQEHFQRIVAVPEAKGLIGTTATFTFEHDNGGCSRTPVYSWSITDPNGNRVLQYPQHDLNYIQYQFNEAGDYEIAAFVLWRSSAACMDDLTREFGGGAREAYYGFSAGEPPQAQFTWSPQSPRVGETIQFTDTSTSRSKVDIFWNWLWIFDGEAFREDRNPTYVFTTPGPKEVSLSAQNMFGSTTVTHTVTVGEALTADFHWDPDHPAVGEEVQFQDASTGNPETWSWEINDGFTSTQRNPRHAFAEAKHYGVTLTVTRGAETKSAFKMIVVGATNQLEARFNWHPENPAAGEEVRFVDQSHGDPERWIWDFTDGFHSTDRNPRHVFARDGEYGISLRVEKGSQHHSFLGVIRIGGGDEAVPNFSWTPGTPEPGQEVRFLNLSTNDPDSFLWDFGDDTPTSVEREPRHTFASEGTYQVTLTATNAAGGGSKTIPIEVSSGEKKPTANFDYSPKPAIVDKPVHFTDTSTGKPKEWDWRFAGFGTSDQQNPTFVFPTTGEAFVDLTVKNSKGTSTVRLPVVIEREEKAPKASFTFTPSEPVTGQTVTFTDTSQNEPRVWKWTFGDGVTAEGKTVTHAYTTTGSKTVSLTVSNDGGSDVATETLTVKAVTGLAAAFRVAPAEVVVDKPVQFIDESSGAPEAWSWDFGDGSTSTEQSPTHVYTSGGLKRVILHVRRGDRTSPALLDVQVHVPPVAKFKTIGPLTIGSEVDFEDKSDGPVTKWKWAIDGQPVSSNRTFVHKFAKVGRALVNLTVENAAGSDSVTRSIEIRNKDAADRPMIVSLTNEYGPCFFSAPAIDNSIGVLASWNGLFPGSVTLAINGGSPEATPADPDEDASTDVVLDTGRLSYAGDVFTNRVVLSAVANNGDASDPRALEFYGYPLPRYFDYANSTRLISEPSRKAFVRVFLIPPSALSATIMVPKIVPFFGGHEVGITKTQFKAEQILRTDCSTYTNVEVSGGLKIAGGFGGIKGSGTSDVKLSKETGINESTKYTGSLEGFLGMKREDKVVELLSVAMKGRCEWPLVKSLCQAAEVKSEVIGSLGGSFEFKPNAQGTPEFDKFLALLKVQVLATGKIEARAITLEAFGGGKGGFKFGPWTKEPFVQKFDFSFELGARIIAYAIQTEFKLAAGCAYEPATDWYCGNTVTNAKGPQILETASWSPMTAVPAQSRERGPIEEAVEDGPVVLRNVSSLADAKAAARDDRAMVVYLSENESAHGSHRLDVRSLVRTGTGGWSEPANVTSDATGDFNPTVVFASADRAIAAWERLRSSNLSYDDVTDIEHLPKITRDVEIAAAVYDHAANAWSTTTMLSANDLFDHSPALAALADGRTIAAWLREPPDGAGTQQIIVRMLQGETWTEEAAIASGLRGIERIALAAKGDEAHLVVAHDADLALFVYRGSTWTRSDLTKDSNADAAPILTIEPDGVRLYWTRDGTLVSRILPDGVIETVREDDGLSGPAGLIAGRTPNGSAFVAWTSSTGILGRTRDPQSKQWSGDLELVKREGVPGSLSAFALPDGMLHIVGLETAVEYSDVQRTIDGKLVTIERVAAPGRIDLVEYELSTRVDLAATTTLVPESRHPSPGESVVLATEFQNAGHLAVRDVVAELRRGSTVVATQTIPGDWRPGELKALSFTDAYDAAAPRYTVTIDPANATGDVERSNNAVTFAFDNRPPLPCLQASRVSGAAPLEVVFDGRCSTDGDGTIAAYSWSFSDGDLTAGPRTTHRFMEPGSYSAALTVTDNLGLSDTKTVDIHVATGPDWRMAAGPHSLYIPIVGRTAGTSGSFFVTDAGILNTDSVADLEIDAVYMPDGRSDTFRERITLTGGELLQATDLMAKVFGAADGTGSLRLDLSRPHAIAAARIYNAQPEGTAGFSTAALRRESALRDGERGVVLQHWLPGYRTNIGFTEIGGSPSEIAATVYDEQGKLLGEQTFGIGPYEHAQINSLPLFQRRGRIEISVRGGTVLPYVTTIDGSTGDPIYQVTEKAPAADATSLLIPVVARLAGANDSTWRSDVRIFNPAVAAQTVALTLKTDSAEYPANVTLAAGETISYDDVIARVYPQLTGNISGALTIDAPSPVMATSRTFNLTAKGTYGLYVPARRAEELLAAGETAYLIQLQENGAYRCNFGMTALDGPGAVTLRAFDSSGKTLATKEYFVAAGQNMQVSRVFVNMGLALPLDAVGLEVLVTEGRLFVYASVNDNRTGDGTFVEAAR